MRRYTANSEGRQSGEAPRLSEGLFQAAWQADVAGIDSLDARWVFALDAKIALRPAVTRHDVLECHAGSRADPRTAHRSFPEAREFNGS
jgi:hypothetical protein